MPDRDTHAAALRRYWLAALAAIIGASVYVYWTSTARPMWVDEEMLALNVRDRTFTQLTGSLWLDQSAPLGWLTLDRLIFIIVGTGERAVRLLTTLFGIATIGTAFWIGRRWLSPIAATILVALCAFGEWIVFFTLEAKHYSADTFLALLLPALAAWVFDDDEHAILRRAVAWWTAAAIGLWFSNGALFVTPGCAASMCALIWRRNGFRVAAIAAFAGLIWAASFAIDYVLVLKPALGNAYLNTYWAFAFPPTADGLIATITWFGRLLSPFAVKPAGSGYALLFWVCWVAGIAVATASGSALAVILIGVPASAVALAVLHFVPPFERLALWIVPSLYVGLALCVDAWPFVRGRFARATALASGLGFVLTLSAVVASANIAVRGIHALEVRPRSNYGLDDRSSVRWLMSVRQPGDVVMTTHYGLAAIWWYSGTNVSNPDAGGLLGGDTPMYEIGHLDPGSACTAANDAFHAAIAGRSRLVVYLGFRMVVEPEGFDDLVLATFGRRWPLVAYKDYAEGSRVAIFDLRESSGGPVVIPSTIHAARPHSIDGCVGIKSGKRW